MQTPQFITRISFRFRNCTTHILMYICIYEYNCVYYTLILYIKICTYRHVYSLLHTQIYMWNRRASCDAVLTVTKNEIAVQSSNSCWGRLLLYRVYTYENPAQLTPVMSKLIGRARFTCFGRAIRRGSNPAVDWKDIYIYIYIYIYITK